MNIYSSVRNARAPRAIGHVQWCNSRSRFWIQIQYFGGNLPDWFYHNSDFSMFAHVQKALPFDKIKSAILFQIVKNVVGYILNNVLSSIQNVSSILFPSLHKWFPINLVRNCHSINVLSWMTKNVWIYLIFVWIFQEKFNTLSIINSDQSVVNVLLYWMRGKYLVR